MGFKLLDACLILDMMGMAMEGTPLERRAKLLGFAPQRARTYKLIGRMGSAMEKVKVKEVKTDAKENM